ncbi:MAG: deoxyribodipyrimidine photo-lyase [Hyphomicrobiales bacterium]|nr:MAG: deoxyribodipyrimidine photo-lyase [Hyphomicrobiales bacterium]
MAANTLVWLRNDLRVRDNPALSAALKRGERVVAVYVAETDKRLRARGAASRWWLHHSLTPIAADLAAMGVRLETVSGSILDAVAEHGPQAVYWNRRYAPAEREVDAQIKATLRETGVEAESFAGNALVEPFDIATKTGTPYAVYTPFWNALRERDIAAPLQAPHRHGEPVAPAPADTAYRTPAWARKFEQYWKPGEAAARDRLADFLDRIEAYPEGRDYPARDATSTLSPYLAHGEISARQAWHAARALAEREPGRAGGVQKFLMELAWRDFNIHQLYHREDIATVPMQAKFRHVKWRRSDSDLQAWQRGETGIAIVDAGMKELWETGFMQNRVRMLTASLLAKNLLIDWRLGEQWFWDCLVDADSASNPGNWQWVAGCGNDAAPYFRIFNPDTQAGKFDPGGDYVRRWAPEPREPIVDLKTSRERALAVLKAAS